MAIELARSNSMQCRENFIAANGSGTRQAPLAPGPGHLPTEDVSGLYRLSRTGPGAGRFLHGFPGQVVREAQEVPPIVWSLFYGARPISCYAG